MNYKFKALPPGTEIRKLLLNSEQADVHLDPDYLKLFQEYTGQKAVFLSCGNEEEYVACPYFLRPVKDTQFFDLVSPWYYGGPFWHLKNPENLPVLREEFLRGISNYCRENNIVSEFQRLNPITKNNRFYDKNTYFNRTIAYIDLSKDYETLTKEYAKKARKNIKRAKSHNLIVKRVQDADTAKTFLSVYQVAMKSKQTRKFYLFNQKFIDHLLEYFGERAQIFLVEHEGRVICASLELAGYKILHDYLRGAESESLEMRPNDILIDEIIRWAKQQGYLFFSLGGGATASEDNGIFRFKKSFSSTTTNFYVYKKVHNREKYDKLAKNKNPLYEKSEVFPEYLE